MSATNSIMPKEKGAAPLDVVIAVMAFLAALSLGASLVAERAAVGWRAGLANRLTNVGGSGSPLIACRVSGVNFGAGVPKGLRGGSPG